MTDMVSVPSIDELDDEFDLDIRIDDIDPTDPNRIHLASFAMSCSMCCPGDSYPSCELSACRTIECTDYSECLCTGAAC